MNAIRSRTSDTALPPNWPLPAVPFHIERSGRRRVSPANSRVSGPAHGPNVADHSYVLAEPSSASLLCAVRGVLGRCLDIRVVDILPNGTSPKRVAVFSTRPCPHGKSSTPVKPATDVRGSSRIGMKLFSLLAYPRESVTKGFASRLGTRYSGLATIPR